MKKINPWIGVAAGALLASGCRNEFAGIDFRQEMIGFVTAIGAYARDSLGAAGFGVFPQNGEGLSSAPEYRSVIDGIGREDIYYGYEEDDVPTDADVTAAIEASLDLIQNAGRLVLTIDYATTPSHIDDAYQKSSGRGYVPYVTTRALDRIFDNGHLPDSTESHDVTAWSDVRHFVYVLQYGSFADAEEFVAALAATYYDLAIVDYSFDGTETGRFTPDQVARMKEKGDGLERRVIAYLSIGEAEDYRYYWHEDWHEGAPGFLYRENPDWPGNYKVKYWDRTWQAIVLGYVEKIVEAGFDGVYLDIIDAYEYFADE